MKKLLAAILALLLVVELVPLPAKAAGASRTFEMANPYEEGGTLMEITRDNAPIRSGAAEKNGVVRRCALNEVISVHGSCRNRYHNLWYKTHVNGETCYIYSGNVKKHSHHYTTFDADGLVYRACTCGQVTLTVDSDTEEKIAAMAGIPLAAGCMDGPLPIADAISWLAYGSLALGVMLSAKQAAKDLSQVDFKELVRRRGREHTDNSCPVDTYRKVVFDGNNIRYVDNDCMSAGEAFGYVLKGGHVHTYYRTSAALLGSMYKDGHFKEQDCNDFSGGHYWHFHLGTAYPRHTVGGHIFYGTGKYNGQRPAPPLS